MMPVGSEINETSNLDPEMRMPLSESSALQLRGFVAFQIGEETITLAVIDAIHLEQSLVTVRVMVPAGPGPWQGKTWSLDLKGGTPNKDQVETSKLIARVELEGNRLTTATVELLRPRGVAI